MQIIVKYNQITGPLPHFWQSTGFTPANLLLNADMRQAMAYFGALPHDGPTYVRIHYLLELVQAEGLGKENPTYDWTQLDKGLDVLVRNGLKPFFELMGNVAGYFTDYTDPTQAHAWRRLVRDLAQHYIERYGQDEVRQWVFETWNEPDVHFWKQSIEALCIYYDACVEGLKQADPALTIGGPGTCRNLSDTLKGFLAHCDTGINFFTGEKGVRLDFISVHEKGVRSHPEDLTPDSMGIVERESRIVAYIRAHHPRFANLPFINDECDPQVGWGTIHTWRARPYYAAFVCKAINQHLVKLADEKGVNYHLLSNDNGFLGTWGHRTHFARFAEFDHIDHGQADDKRDAPRSEEDVRRRKFELIKKPVFTVMTLLSLLGNERVTVTGAGDVSEDVGIIATKNGDQHIAILVYNSRDKIMSSGVTPLTLHLEGLPFKRATLVHYRIDEEHGNPFSVWETMGAPRFPDAEHYAQIRAAQEIVQLDDPQDMVVDDGILTLEFDLPLPGVSLLTLSVESKTPPTKVTNLRAERYEGMTDNEEILLIWDKLSPHMLQTYEVLYAPTEQGPFKRINPADQIDGAYLHSAPTVAGVYKVRAIDHWGRMGETSDGLVIA